MHVGCVVLLFRPKYAKKSWRVLLLKFLSVMFVERKEEAN